QPPRKAGATVRNQNPRTSKIALRLRSDHCCKAVAASYEAVRNRHCQYAQADCESPVACSRPAMTPVCQRAGSPPHSISPVPQREAPAAPLAAELCNQAAAIRRCVDKALMEPLNSKPRYPRPKTSVGAHRKGSARPVDQVRAASNTHSSGCRCLSDLDHFRDLYTDIAFAGRAMCGI